MILLFCILLIAGGCKEEELKPSSLILNTDKIEIPSEGGEFRVTYRLESPVYDGVVSIDNQPEWVKDVNTSVSGEITFAVDANEELEYRTAELLVEYSGASEGRTLIIRQLPKVIPPVFDITIELVTQTAAKYSVVPGDKEQTYVSMLVEKEYFDSYQSDEEYFQDDLKYIREMAESFGVSLEEYLSNTLSRGDLLVKNMTGLLPGTEYYVYAYGLTVSGERTTDIYKEQFETVSVPKIDMTFTMDAVLTGPLCDLSVIPSDNEQRYVIGMYASDGVPDAETAVKMYQQYILDMIAMYEVMGMTPEEIVAGLSAVGKTSRTYELDENRGYIVFAASCTDNGLINSDPVSKTFTTETVRPSDNEITFEVAGLEAHQATVNIKTTNRDPYVIYLARTDLFSGKGDDEIIQYIKSAEGIEEYIRRGDVTVDAAELEDETSYTLYAFGYVTGKVNTGLFSTSFTTKSAVPADIEIVAEHSKYFDGTEVEELYPEDYSGASGQAVLPITVRTEGEPAEKYYYYIYEGDLTSDIILTDKEAIAALFEDGISESPVAFFLPYDDESTLLAFAVGTDGNYSKVYREKIVLSRDGVSPIDEFRPYQASESEVIEIPEMQFGTPLLKLRSGIEESERADAAVDYCRRVLGDNMPDRTRQTR